MTAVSAPSTRRPPDRRFLHLWLYRLPIDRVRLSGQGPAEGPLALIVKQASALRLQSLDAAAEALGLTPGLTVADARARAPELQVMEADPRADLAVLTWLGEACRRYTPSLAIDPPAGVDLDITGTDALFDGERALVGDLVARFRAKGLHIRIGLADTPGLAWGLARFGKQRIAPVGKTAEMLAELPIAALRLEPDALAVLGRLGLRRVSQVMALPRAGLAKRLGEEVVRRLDEALGDRAAPLLLRLEASPRLAEQRLAEPIVLEEQVLRLAEDLALRLCRRLEGEGLGGRRFVLELFRMDGAVKRIEVASSRPLRHPGRIAALFAERLAGLGEGLEADFGFDLVRLSTPATAPFVTEAGDFIKGANDDADFAGVVDRIDARLGAGAVRRLEPATHTQIPERVVRAVRFGDPARAAWRDASPARYGEVLLRPLRLFASPQPLEVTAAEIPEGPPARFTWRRVERRIVGAEGPERIEPEWGREGGEARVRDYYRLEDDKGLRYWVFREGHYGDDPDPRWWLHGLFP
jgi:protein ImuB